MGDVDPDIRWEIADEEKPLPGHCFILQLFASFLFCLFDRSTVSRSIEWDSASGRFDRPPQKYALAPAARIDEDLELKRTTRHLVKKLARLTKRCEGDPEPSLDGEADPQPEEVNTSN